MPKITAMCVFNPLQPSHSSIYGLNEGTPASQRVAVSADLLAIGFSNGVLLLYDTLKSEVVYKNLSFTKGRKAIDQLKSVTFQVRDSDGSSSQNSSLASMSGSKG